MLRVIEPEKKFEAAIYSGGFAVVLTFYSGEHVMDQFTIEKGFNYLAEAQERADELNGECDENL